MTWTNWAGDQTCSPLEVATPSTVAEVQACVRDAAKRDLTVRAVGAGHSFSEAALTDGVMVSLDRMTGIIDADRSSGLVKVWAGTRLRDLNEALDAHGLAMENLGDVDVQSIAGATATGTHGTGARLRNISAAVVGAELVRGDGEVVEIDAASEDINAARVNLGALGIVTSLTLQTVPAFTLHAVDAPAPLEDVLADLPTLVKDNEHFEFYTFPHSPLAHTRTNNRTTERPRPRSKRREWFDDIFMRNRVLGSIFRLQRRFPRTIPVASRTIPRLAGTTERVEASHRIFVSPRRFRFTETEWAIPIERAAEAVAAVRAIADDHSFKVAMPIEVRFVAADEAYLSPSGGRDSCYVAVHAFEGMPWRGYFTAVEELMLGFEGRPHWGKRHTLDRSTVARLYPRLTDFFAVRDRFDPNGRFVNGYLQRVFGR